jgi:uncharacterized protein (DUF2141 family)
MPRVFAGSEVAVELSGIVSGASGRHSIYIALWGADDFLKKPSQQLRVDPPAAPQFRFRVRPGRWALSAFEDVNGNGILDMGVFGPKEPSGFWSAFHAWRKPRFDDVAVQVERDTLGIEIKLGR